MQKSYRYKGFVINDSGPREEPKLTKAQKEAMRIKTERRRKIDDMMFEKKLGIYGELD